MENERILEHIQNWLLKYAQSARANGFIVGISGGIDSALTSTLCARTGLSTHCVSMPIHQKPDQLKRAHEHIQWLMKQFPNVRTTETDLTSAFESFKEQIPATASSHLLSMANTRSRLRMLTLYAIGQSEGLLVAGTGNKVEDFGVGFFTKYGDGGVDLSPIADLTKTQVYALCKHLGVVESIQTAAPTDGLWDADHTDEHQLGATYPELEWAMEFANGKMRSEDLNTSSLTEREKEVLEIYLRFHRQNHHKMIPIPVCEIPEELF